MSRNDTDRGRLLELEPIGVIDIGSNSVRLVVYEGAVRTPTPIFNEKVLAGLGRSIATTGLLGAEAVDRALAALVRYRAIARILGVKNLRAIATAACREAKDGAAFIRRAEQASGVRIDVLTGEEEAELAAYGIRMGFHEPDGLAGDLGGGSLEIIDLDGGKLRDATTLPLGGLRLIDTSKGRIDDAIEIADQAIRRVPWLPQGRGRTFFAVGGTWRALAKLHMEEREYPLRVMHGYAVNTDAAIRFCENVRRARTIKQIKGGANIAKARREVLPYGALALERLLKRVEPSSVVFSVFGIREGLVYRLLSTREQRKDPLIAFATDYARLRARSLAHAHELAQWTDVLFDEVALRESDEERRLRHAACIMSDIGWRAHPDYRGEQSLSVVAHAALAGIDHPGRIFLALAIFFRHDGPDDEQSAGRTFSDRLQAMISPRLLRRTRIIGAAIRVAHMLSVGRAGIIDEAPLSVEQDTLVLTLPRNHAVLDGERLRRRLDDLAALLERKAEVRFGR
jgi:exopolyphosphatase/guanosine-5'-triphosphate,3'-diphosphate pyrophosphatase